MHGSGDGSECESGEQGGKFREQGGDIPHGNRQDGRGHEELREGNDRDIGGQADGGGAVKIICHGQGQAHLHDGRDQQKCEGAQANHGHAAHHTQRPWSAEETRQAAGNHAQVRAELGNTRRKRRAVIAGVPLDKSAAVETRSAFHEGQPDCRYDEDAKKGHLEAGGEELPRIEYEQAESGRSQCVDHAAVAIKQARTQKDGDINVARQTGAPTSVRKA